MYLEFYKLHTHPFQITCDPKFIWLGEKHIEALSTLRYGIMDSRGLVLLTGEPGTGKTLIINQFLELGLTNTVATTLSVPKLNHKIEFYQLLADSFKFPSPVNNKAEFQIQFKKYLQRIAANNQQVALIIDEAQGLEDHMLDDIRTLSNIEYADKKMINIFLVGQTEINKALLRSENRAVAQRITLRYQLKPLNYRETTDYILHRLKMAGCSTRIFSEDAIEKIYEHTAGIPRLINILCDNALLAGSFYKSKTLYADTIEECAQELFIAVQEQNGTTSQGSGQPVKSVDADSGTEETGWFNAHFPIRKTQIYNFAKWLPVGIVPVLLIILTFAVMNLKLAPPPHSSTKGLSGEHQEQPSAETVMPIAGGHQPSADPAKLQPVPDRRADNSINPGSPQKEKIAVYFNHANHIVENSYEEINLVADNLRKNPERIVNIYGYTAGEVGSFIYRKMVWRLMVDAVKSRLISKGVYPFQIKLVDMENEGEEATPEFESERYVVIEYPQKIDIAAFNQDK